MAAHLRSDKVSLIPDHGLGSRHDELWQVLRRHAVEPSQLSAADFSPFADECLLYARIVINDAHPDPDECISLGEAFQDTVRPFHSHSAAPLAPPPADTLRAGLVYLHAGPANIPSGEASIGIIMKHGMRSQGIARETVQLVLRWAFQDLGFHRVQAAVLDTPFKDRALRLFIGLGFAHEGTKRRAIYQPENEGMAGVWKDVTYLAMLDTEWVLRTAGRRDNQLPPTPPVSVWDEMFARHSREREELLRWEENHGRAVKRVSSTETLRELVQHAAQNMAYLTDDAASVSDSSVSGSPPRPEVVVSWGDNDDNDDAHMADILDTYGHNTNWENVIASYAARQRQRDMGLLDPSPPRHLLALPSIPSPTRFSEDNVHSPLTIPSPSTPGPSPPPSASPSPFAHTPSPGIKEEEEDEDNWLPDVAPPTDPFADPRHPYTGVAGPSRRTRSRSSSATSTSTDSWSDAQSSDSNWDVISNASDHGDHRA